MINVLWLVGMLFASQWGQNAPMADAKVASDVVGGIVGQEPERNRKPLPPIPAAITDSPSLHDIVRTMPQAQRGIPNVYEVWRDDIEFTAEKLVDKIDPPRFFPLVGPAKLHHLHWKCTVSYSETVKIWYPVPMMLRTKRTEVVYFDKDHLIPCAAEAHRPDQRIVACWDARVHACDDAVNPRTKLSMLKGSVYLHCGQKTICANGTMLVEACDRDGRKLAQWQFDAATLEKLKRTDLIGVGYTLCLPLDQRCLAEKDLRLTLKYSANDGKTCCDEPTRVTLRRDAPGVVPAVHEEQLFLGTIPPIPARGVCDGAQQIHLVVLMAQISPAAMKHLKIETQKPRSGDLQFAVVKNSDGVVASLQTLRSLGFVKVLAQPNIVTLCGRPASFQCGGEKPILIQTSNGPAMTFKNVGVKLDLLPTMTQQGKIRLEVCPEIATSQENAISQRIARLSTDMNDGQTLVILGSGFTTDKGEKQDLVLIVTPHLIQSADAKASKQMSFTEIATLSKRGISDDIIIRQMELTESIYDLTTGQILSLHEHGVSNAVIRVMQERRTNCSSGSCTPRSIVPASAMPR